jgi:hypothetical protein
MVEFSSPFVILKPLAFPKIPGVNFLMMVNGVELLDFGPDFKPEGGRLTHVCRERRTRLVETLRHTAPAISRGHGYRLNSVPLDN